MRGVLTAKADAEEELKFATSLINQVTEGMRGCGTKIDVHVCRSNWSTDESTLLRGPYDPVMPYFKQMNIELGLDVVNPRIQQLETPEDIVARVNEAANYIPAEKIFLNPDCGFGTFAQRPMNTEEIAFEKLKVLVKATEMLSGR